MNDPPTIVRDNQTLFSSYHKLKKNDIICGRIRLKPGEEHLLVDLLDRGIQLLPSATSQLASRSKVFQAQLLSDFMLPGTLPIYDTHGLLSSCSLYKKLNYTKVILKRDRKNAGLGVHVFNNIEDLYNLASGVAFDFPFVIQPYEGKHRDIRVIILGNYIEAYERSNPYNFRKNLHCGGESTPCEISKEELRLCKEVMERGRFPYCHIDLMLLSTGKYYLTEINLRGGLRGAKISGKEYLTKLDELHEALLNKLHKSNS